MNTNITYFCQCVCTVQFIKSFYIKSSIIDIISFIGLLTLQQQSFQLMYVLIPELTDYYQYIGLILFEKHPKRMNSFLLVLLSVAVVDRMAVPVDKQLHDYMIPRNQWYGL